MKSLEIEVPKIYEPCFNDLERPSCCKCLWYSPRTSWKSSGLGRLIYIYYTAFAAYDVCVGVDSITNAGEGVLSEFRAFIEAENLNSNGDWIFTPKCIYNKRQKNQVRSYAVQTNELHNVNATKSKKLIRPISLFIMDEVQKLHNKQILLNCLSTFLRQMKAGHSKVVLAGNPDRTAMWFDAFYKDKLSDDKWTVLKPTYLDIIEWIPKALLHEIEQTKKTDMVAYRQIYIGDLDVAGWQNIFHSFIAKKHYVPRQYFLQRDNYYEHNIHALLIGVDDAESVDALAASANTLHANGQLRAQELLYKSMKELPTKPALSERCDMFCEYLDYIQLHFNKERLIPIYISIDCASGMYQQLYVRLQTDVNYMRWRNVTLIKYTAKQDKEKQLDMMNAAFSDGTLTIVNVDDYSPQYSNAKLVEELKAALYLENKKLDGNVPNDSVDALQYGVMLHLLNPYNLSLPKRLERYKRDETFDTWLEKFLEKKQR